MTPRLNRAISCAQAYRILVKRGDIVLAQQTRQTIDDLVGRPVGRGRVLYPKPVAEAMGRPELADDFDDKAHRGSPS